MEQYQVYTVKIYTTKTNVDIMQQHKLQILDYDTGELIDMELVQNVTDDIKHDSKNEQQSNAKKIRTRFQKIFVTNMCNDIIFNHALTQAEKGTLLDLIMLTGWQNNIVLKPQTLIPASCDDIAKVSGLSNKTVIKHLTNLCDKGFIAIVSGRGHSKNYIVNTNLSVKGSTLSDLFQYKIFNNSDWPYKPSVIIKYSKFT